MRQVWIPRIGGPEVLEVREAPDPVPGPGQVRVAVEAAGVNFADVMARMGIYPDAPPVPCVVGYEVSGSIDAVGDGVDASRIGEPVIGLVRFGGYSTHVVVDARQVVRRPDGIDAITGAAIPVTGVTCWLMLEVFGRVRAGDRVLVHSAGGGVGLMALDLLKWRGAYAIGTASARKHDTLRTRGYDQLIDYTTEDYEAVLRDGPGLDLVLDPLGGDSWAKGLRLLRAGGRLVAYGMSVNAAGDQRSILTVLKNLWSVPWRASNPLRLIDDNIGICGVNAGHLWDEADRVTGWLGEVVRLCEAGTVRPHVHAAVPFAEAAEAHRILHRRENVGKVVLVP